MVLLVLLCLGGFTSPSDIKQQSCVYRSPNHYIPGSLPEITIENIRISAFNNNSHNNKSNNTLMTKAGRAACSNDWS